MPGRYVLRSVLATVIVVVMVASSLGGAHASPAAARPHGGSSSFGVVYIWSNGTISNPSAPISVSGSTYTLTGELNGSLVVMASEVTINGAYNLVNYTVGEAGGDGAAVSINSTDDVSVYAFLSVNDSVGIMAWNTTNVDIEDNQVTGSTAGILVNDSEDPFIAGNNESMSPNYGIELNYTDYSGVFDNLVNGSKIGLYIDNSSYPDIEWNSANHTVDSIEIYSSSGAYIENNEMENDSGYGLYAYSSPYVTVINNWANTSGDGLEADNSHGIQFENNYVWFSMDGVGVYEDQQAQLIGNSVEFTYYPIWSEYSSQVTFADNNAAFSTGYAYYGYEDQNVQVTGNDLASPQYYAAYTESEFNVTFANNNMSNALDYGVYVYESGDVTISGNNISDTPTAIYLEDPYGSLWITGNNLSSTTYGVYTEDENYGSMTVSDNIIVNSEYGVYVGDQYGDTNILGNNMQDDEYGAYVYDGYAPVVIQSNDIANSSSIGVYLEDIYADATVSNNNLSNAQDTALETDGVYSPLKVSNNVVENSSDYGLYLENDGGLETVIGNDVRYSQDYAIYDYDNGGGMLISGNNASGSYVALYVQATSFDDNEVTGNDLSNSQLVTAVSADFLNGFFGNNMLNVSQIAFDNSHFDMFYHNDINSTAFSAGTSICSGGNGGTWNDPYPVGGNYWTGYTGIDTMWGSAQNQPGEDGIGDTPFLVGGVEDMYPLMYAWFSPMVTFTESGLPSGTLWSVMLDWSSQSSTTGPVISFPETNGAYTSHLFMVGSVPGFVANPSSGVASDYGTGVNTNIVFKPFTYAVNFTESGLPAGTSWSVTIGSKTNTSTNPWLVLDEPNGTWTYTIGSVPGYTSTGSGQVTVSAAPAAVAIAFTAIQHAVYFNETGLVAGTAWSVTIGATNLASAGSTIVFSLPDGSYTYSVGAVPGFTTTWSGPVIVNGKATSVLVAFVPTEYRVVFNESGLASGTSWSLTVDGKLSTSTSTSIGYMMRNGTYGFVPGDVPGYISPSPGSLTVAGSPTNLTLVYTPVIPPTPVYTVAVMETGLPNGTDWSATVGGTPNSGTGSVLLFYEPNGTYEFSASAAGYVVQGPGAVQVAGADKVVSVAFSLPSPSTFSVTFTETGLPSGTTWYVSLGSNTLSSATSTIVFAVVNGTYTYTVGSSAAYVPTPSTGQEKVTGAALTVTIEFSTAPPGPASHYAIAVTETGLPSGASWSATIGNTTVKGTGATLLFEMQNGTYSFSTTASGYTVQGPAKVVVKGADQVVSVIFTQPSTTTYSVTFDETGLPSGTTWYVSLGNTIYSSVASTVVFTVANGTYSYSIGTTNGYVPALASGQETVNGAAVSVSVNFTAPSTETTTQGAPNSEVYGLVAGLVLLALLALVGWAMYVRKQPKPSSTGSNSGEKKGENSSSEDASEKTSTTDGETPKNSG
jgi:parallel beta-helix repeat protein